MVPIPEASTGRVGRSEYFFYFSKKNSAAFFYNLEETVSKLLGYKYEPFVGFHQFERSVDSETGA